MRRPSLSRLTALRTGGNLAVLGIGASVCGAVVVALLLALAGAPAALGDRVGVLTVVAVGYVAAAAVAGTVWTVLLQRRTAFWFAGGRTPSLAEAQRALRLPADLAVVTSSLWLVGTILLGSLAEVFAPGWPAIGLALAVAMGGIATTAISYLLAERVARPVLTVALEVAPPRGMLSVTVRSRLVLTWALASGLPLLAVLLVLTLPTSGRGTAGVIALAVVGLVVGALATALFARAVTAPLRRMRWALDRIALGSTDVTLPVDDSSEIGLLQVSVNDMVSGLRERQRMRDLFDRHVGTDVARHALESGVSLSGDVREVTALFVDVVESTSLANRLPPEEIVAKLNRLFSTVVDAVAAEGGLVNKFQGDAALCVFGAPTPHPAAQTAALRAARAIRDGVREAGELDLGIGVACGEAFAGQLGAAMRLEYTVIGDPVNEAARLTDKAKRVPGRILASKAVVDACDELERERWRSNGSTRLRGRAQRTSTWVDRPTQV